MQLDICIIKTTYKMNTMEKTVVRKIEWYSNEEEMLLMCDIQNGAFTYSSKIALAGSALNKVLSNLQKQNPDRDINDCLQIEQWSEEDVTFCFDFSYFFDSEFVFVQHAQQIDFRQIRA